MSPAPERRAELEGIFRDALAAVDAEACVRAAVAGDARRLAIAGRPLPQDARLSCLAVGKAAAVMARGLESAAGPRIARGLAVTRDGHGCELEHFTLREAAHPVPDARSESAAAEALELVASTQPDDVLCVLLSGGASSLLASPAEGLSREDLARTTQQMLDAGADIVELNTVRKHLSSVAGGLLAARTGAARIDVLAISDVPGDRLDVIGSGLFAADPSTFSQALDVLEKLGLADAAPASVRRHLIAGTRGERPETLEPGSPGLAGVRTQILASNRQAVEAALESARRRGLRVRLVSEPLRGEARDEARRLTSLASRLDPDLPTCLVAGGETTVRVRGPGRGGRSQELALAAALELHDGPPCALLACGTDGSDGSTDAAGAYADEGTLRRGVVAGVDAREALSRNDSYGFFSAEGGLLVTGPTGTNVMDLVLLRVEPLRGS